MEQVIATVMYNGQFWIILIERISDTGAISCAKHTFGPEPTFNDLANFYDNIFPFLRFYPTDALYRVKKKYSKRELDRMENKSMQIFKEAQREYLSEKKKEKRKLKALSEKEAYMQKQIKKKHKKSGK